MRKVAVLAAVAALLAAYLLLGDRGAEVSEGARERARLVTAFDRATVQRIVISRAGAAPFSLERQPPGIEPAWRESPGDKPADGAAVEDLLNALDVAETTRTADVDLAEAGLAPPKVSIELSRPDGAVSVALGRTDANGQGVFSRVGDAAAIRVAPRRLLDLADREPWAFRDRRLVPLAPDAVTAIGWDEAGGGGERRVRLVKGRWQNETEQPVSNERVAESLRRMLALRVVRYQATRPNGRSKGPPSRIFVEGVRGTTVVLMMDDATCSGWSDAFVQRDGAAGDGLCVDPEALRQVWPALAAAHVPDLRLLSAPPATVKRVDIDARATRLVLVRTSAGGWRLDAPKVVYAIDPRLVDDWLAALARVEVGPAPAAANPRLRRLIVDGRYREETAVAPGDPGFAQLDPDPLRFRDRAVLDFAHFDARALQRSAGAHAVELTSRDGEDWRAAPPARGAVDRSNVARVVGALGNLRAETFLVTAPRGAPELTLEVDVQAPGEGAPARHRLDLYKTKEAPGCAGRLDRDLAFSLAAAACSELRLPLGK
jgi:hypothetical protein